MAAPRVRDCPCHSGRPYRDCCQPFHSGNQAAPTPEALMRSRYSAFALGLHAYLEDTLVAGHPYRGAPPPGKLRYLGLRILHASSAAAASAEVLFVARIFDKGVDRSFAELSRFVREPGAAGRAGLVWRYVDGDLLAANLLPPSIEDLTRESFLELVKKHAMAN